jgi:hypothetical protein
MLIFIVPVKSREITQSWKLLSRLLERCLKSICNQTSPNFKVIVICNQIPEITFSHPSIHYLEVNFPVPKTIPQEREKIKGYEHIHSLDIANKNADKARKILRGIEYARQFNPSHVMVVDADDCVSCHLVEFVDQHPEEDGWVMRKGYLYREGSRFLYVNQKKFNHVSGTSLLIKYDKYLVAFENPDFYRPSFDEFPDGVDIKPLPFIGALYSMLNGENILMNHQTFNQMQGQILMSIPALLQKIFRYRICLLNRSIIKEFSLYSVT